MYVDKPTTFWRGQQWAHLVADTEEELHTFAQSIGLRRNWFQGASKIPHYDVSTRLRELALKEGAMPVRPRELVIIGRRMRDANPK